MRPARRSIFALTLVTFACSSPGTSNNGADGDGDTNVTDSDGSDHDVVDNDPGDGEPSGTIARITLSPASVTFTASGQTQPLTIAAFDGDGHPVSTSGLTFTSSSRNFATVDANGVVTAVADIGSALIQVTSGTVVSNPVTALGVRLQPGVALLNDADIVTAPSVVDATTVRLTVRDIGALAVGSLFVGGGSIPIAGRITAINGTSLDVVDVPITDLVRDLTINMFIEGVRREPLATVQRFGGPQRSLQAAKKTIGVFECESEVDLSTMQAEIEATLAPPYVMFEIRKDIVNGVDAGTTVIAHSSLKLSTKAVFRMGAAITGEVVCSAKLGQFVAPVFGLASIIAAPVLPVGFEASLAAEVSYAAFSFGFNNELEALASLGFRTTSTGYEPANSFDMENNLEPVITFPGEQSPRAKVTAFAGITAELSIGFGNLGTFSVDDFSLAKVSVGPEMEAKATGLYTAAADPTFETGYELKGKVALEPGDDLQKVFEHYLLPPGGAVDFSVKTETPFATSPKSTLLTADTTQYALGDTVHFEVTMDYDSSTFPVIGPNVQEVRLYALDWSAHTATLVGTAAGADTLTYTFDWTADRNGTLNDPITGDPKFYAYVVDKALNVLSSVLPFELGAFVGRPEGRHIAAAGSATLWLKADGKIHAAGRNQAGLFGESPGVGVYTGGTLLPYANVASMQADNWVSVALIDDGNVYARGWGPLVGSEQHDNPAARLITNHGIAIASGYDHTLILRDDGSVWGFGDNSEGRLGNAANAGGDTGLGPAIAIAAGAFQSIAVRPDGTVYSVGKDLLGNGVITDGSSTPVWAFTLEDIVSVAAGDDFALALDSHGEVWAWGRNTYGQLGLGSTGAGQSLPQKVPGLAGVTQISCGRYHAMALANGVVYAWGRGEYGRLGQGNESDSNTPLLVMTSAKEIDAGEFHSLALLNDGSLYGWGYNFDGGLGPSYGEGVKVLSPQNITF